MMTILYIQGKATAHMIHPSGGTTLCNRPMPMPGDVRTTVPQAPVCIRCQRSTLTPYQSNVDVINQSKDNHE
jgi:hypothetical protein